MAAQEESIQILCPHCHEHLGEYSLDPVKNSNALDHYRDEIRKDHYKYDCVEFKEDRVIENIILAPRKKKIK